MLSNVISAYYKTFGQTFIRDDRFLSIVGAITSVFNCSGRLVYGLIMDRFAYKVSMTIEAFLLILLMSTFYLTSLIGVSDATLCDSSPVANITTSLLDCVDEMPPTSLTTKVVFAIWVWAIYLTFPGTYSTQPAVTTQTFGHKYGGFIYAFLFSSDIINNLLVATLSKVCLLKSTIFHLIFSSSVFLMLLLCQTIKNNFGWLGLFLIISGAGVIALLATLFFPLRPRYTIV